MKYSLEAIDTRFRLLASMPFAKHCPTQASLLGWYFVPQTSDQEGAWFFDPHLPIFQRIRLSPVLGLATTLGSS